MDISNAIEKHGKLVVGVVVAFIIGGAAVTLISSQSTQKEKSAQEAYFAVEKKLLDAKNRKANPEAAKKDEKAEPPADFAGIKKDLEKVIADYPGSIAAQMAALHYAGLLVDEKNFDVALSTLQKVESKKNGLVNTLVQQQIGQLMADKDNCKEAIVVWQKILDRKEAEFIHDDTRIQQALCYAKMNDNKKAEEILTNLANKSAGPETGNSPAAHEAEKYLRLLMFKKASGT